MGATARDVAARAGVSVFTVSRALARPATVSPATRTRVVEAATALGYVPRVSTRSPGAGTARAVGLAVRDAADPYTTALVQGVRNRANGAGYTVTVVDVDRAPSEEALLGLADGVDGVVVAAPHLPDDQLLRLAERRPVVLVNHRAGDLPGVRLDYGEGVRQALACLRALGHHRVALAGGPTTSEMSSRWVAYSTEFAESWPDLEVVDLGGFPLDASGGLAAADLLVDSGATAVCTYHDALAVGLLEGLRLRGVDVPGQISVIGAGEPGRSPAVGPALTAVSVPMRDAGRAVVDVLLSLLRDRSGSPVHHWDLSVHLVLADSTAAVASLR